LLPGTILIPLPLGITHQKKIGIHPLPLDPTPRGIGTPVAIVIAIVIGIIAAFSLGFGLSKARHKDAVVETNGLSTG
jgi:hypothetical protein